MTAKYKTGFALLLTFAVLSWTAWAGTEWQVYFSPDGGATDAIVAELGKATNSVLVQAYSFTSAPIAKALVDAHKRGVKIAVILDKGQKTVQISEGYVQKIVRRLNLCCQMVKQEKR